MNTEFEKHAREQFEGHEVEVDTDALWTNVYPHVKKEKGNGRFVWIFLLGLLAGVVGLSLLNSNANANLNANANENTDTNLSVNSAATADLDFTEVNTISNETSNTNTASDYTSALASMTETKTIAETNINSNTSTSAKSTVNTSASTTTEPATTPRVIIPREKIYPAAAATQNKNVVDTPIEAKTAEPIKQAISFVSNEAPVSKEENTAVVENKSMTNALLIRALNENILSKTDQPQIPESQQENVLNTYKKDLARLKKARRNLRLGIGVYGGISKSTTSLSSNDSISFGAAYAAERNTSEKQLETVHLGIGLTVYSKKGLYLRSGAEYTRIASVYNRSSTTTRTDSVPGITKVIIDDNTGAVIDSIEGIVLQTTTTEFTKKHYNYIHLIDIPVIIGYQFEYEPWSIGVEGGIYANISARYTGEISSPSSDAFYDLEKDENKWFKTNVGIQPYIGLNATYNVSDNLQVHFSPGFRFETLFSTDNNPVQERHSILGIKAGVRYVF